MASKIDKKLKRRIAQHLMRDIIHDAINPPATTVNIGLARLGARAQVGRLIELLSTPTGLALVKALQSG